MPTQPDAPLVSTGQVLVILLAAAFLSVPISLVLLRLYRRAILTAMRQVSQETAPADDLHRSAAPLPAAPSPPPTVDLDIVSPRDLPALTADSVALVRQALRGPWINSLVYAAAGLAFAIAMTALYLGSAHTAWTLTRASILIWIFAWPVVLTMSLLHQDGLARTLRVVAVYGAVLLGLSATQGDSWHSIVFLWLLSEGPPTVYQFLFLHRKLRAVGPLVVVFLVVVIAGAELLLALAGTAPGLQILAAILVRLQLDPTVGLLAVGALGMVLFVLPGWLTLSWLARQYDARQVSDQSLAVDALWLVFACSAGLDLANEGPGYAVAGLGSFLVFKIVAALGFALVGGRASGRLPRRLLLLRVFGSQARSERLMDRVGARWRHAGVIQLIAGTDLATHNLEPHDLLDLLRGRLRQRYVASRAMLERRLAALNLRPDPDGRFRLAEFLCYDNTWRFTLSELATTADAVLMDLRGFTPANQGCIFELHELVDRVPLPRVVLLVDRTTDRASLGDVLQRAGEQIPPDSPNYGAASLRVLACDLSQEGPESVRLVLRSLARAVTAPAPTYGSLSA